MFYPGVLAPVAVGVLPITFTNPLLATQRADKVVECSYIASTIFRHRSDPYRGTVGSQQDTTSAIGVLLRPAVFDRLPDQPQTPDLRGVLVLVIIISAGDRPTGMAQTSSFAITTPGDQIEDADRPRCSGAARPCPRGRATCPGSPITEQTRGHGNNQMR
jgi:hypothetical protein